MTFSRIHARPLLTLACSIAMLGGIAGSRAQADEWNKRTILTTNQPIQVTNKVLGPGQYVFMLDNSNSDRHIVRIFNADQSQLIETVMAVPDYRIRPTGNSRFTFYETPPGTARALRAWFYPGDNFGQEFAYPKHPQIVQTGAATSNPTPNTVAANREPAASTTVNNNGEANREVAPAGSKPPAVTSQTAPAQEDQSAIAQQNQTASTQQNQTAEQQSAGEADRSQPEEQTQIAQNTPPPKPAQPHAQQSQQSNQERHRPAELPKTASPYGLIGLMGLALLGIAGLLHLRRTA